jgi:hypothetical protein
MRIPSPENSMLFVLPWAIGLLAAGVHVAVRPGAAGRAGALRIFVLYQLVLGLGLAGLVGFAGHALRPAETARSIGWPAHPQFQYELAAFELGFAVSALMGLWIRDRRFWLGVTVAPAVFLVLAGVQHAREAIATGNVAPGNLFAMLPDFLIPSTLLLLLYLLGRAERSAAPGGRKVSS